MWQTILNFLKLNAEEARTRFNLGIDVRDWKVTFAQNDLKDSGPAKSNIKPILYRPFDTRFTYYTGRSRGFQCMPRLEVMNHMKQSNISLLFNRREALPGEYADFLVSDKMAEHKASSRYDTCYQAPLYLYAKGKRTTNVNPNLLGKLSKGYGKTVAPEEVFYYIYAVGHSPTYRIRYNNELRQDFPRIPFASDSKHFDAMVSLGKRLTELHLGKGILPPQTRFDIPGSNIVEKVEYSDGRITINNSQYFETIPLELWEFRIGGYQVLEKWLKSRKRRKLEGSEIEYFLNVMEIIRETKSIMKEIDAIPFLSNN